MGCKRYLYHAACIRTCIPLEEATGIPTGKYDLKVRATPAKVRLAKRARFAQISHILVPLQQTCLGEGMLVLCLCHYPITLPSLGYSDAFLYLHCLHESIHVSINVPPQIYEDGTAFCS